jgi:N-acetylglucosaminyl-diphospho-decaprenol L-rhamnosyltransferase
MERPEERPAGSYPRADGPERQAEKRVRIGIVSWNTGQLLDRCLSSLPASTAGLACDVVVVDNASGDGSADIAARHAGVEVIRNRANVGYARAMNQALTHDMGGPGPEVFIALNPDTVAPPRSLVDLTETLLRDPTLGLVVPRLVQENGQLQHSVFRFPSLRLAVVVALLPLRLQRGALARRFWLEGRAPHDRPGDIDWAIGAVHVIRSEAVDPERPYPERWFMYVEDLELCWQLDRTGWRRRLEPDVSILHVGNASGSQAWGAGRLRRILQESYDWYRMHHGLSATCMWAAANLSGAALHWGGSVLASWVTGRRSTAGEPAMYAGFLRSHLVALRSVVAARSPGPIDGSS